MTHAQKDQAISILREFDSGMLVTFPEAGAPRGRPMTMAEVDDDGAIWFVTGVDSSLLSEAESSTRCALELSGSRLWAHVSGRMSVVEDREAAHRVWSDAMDAWFPDGPDSEDFALLRLEPLEVDWWDLRRGGLAKFAVAFVKARLKEERIDDDAVGSRGHATM